MSDLASLYIRVDSTGVVTASKDLAALDTAAAKVEGTTKKVETATASAMANFKKLAGAVGAAALAYQAFTKLMSELTQLVREGFKAVEEYQTSIASLAAMVLTFTEAHNNMNLGERWKEALQYSTEMIPILENLAAKTLLSGRETIALANAFARAGVFLDATNTKQIESFTRLSNALPLMTQGQSIMLQINQEIRALMGGGNMATSMLLQTLKSINPNIEKQLETWRAQGTVLEHLGDLLVGFGPATEILENQWQAVKSTIDTTVTQTLRGGMEPVYKDIIGLVKNMDGVLAEHRGTISAGIVVAWSYVKNIISIVANIISGLKPLLDPLATLTGVIAYGWGGILAVLEPISKIIGNILSMGIEVVKVFGNAVVALGALINLQPEVAKVAANEAIKSAKQVKALAVESADLFVNGIGDSLVRYENQIQTAMTSGKNLAATNKYVFEPVTNGANEATTAAQKLREEADKINETLGNDIKMSGLDGLEKKLFEIQLKYEKLAKNPLVDKGLLSTARGIEESSARWEARSQELKKEAAESKMLREAEIEDALFLLDIEVIRGARYNSTMQERLRLSEEFLAIQKSILEKTDSSDVTAYRAQTKAVQDAMKQVIELQKQISDTSPWEGMMRGINSIIDEYENLGSALESTVVKGIKGMEDALVDFVKTGKLEFKDLADAIIADMIRIMVQQSMLSVMKGASGIGGFLSGILGGLGGAAGSAPVGSFNPGMFSNVAHSGGVIGHGGGVYGIYDSSLFDNAPRLHNGLMPDEFPAILQRGERVIPKNQTGGGGAGGDAEIVTNNITINAVDAKSFSDMCKQNPDAIFGPIMSRLKNNKNRTEMKRALT